MLVAAVVTTLAATGLLLSFLRNRERRPRPQPRADRRRQRPWARRDPREALALVGSALAATHDPKALLPVILEVTVEATGARGGRVLEKRSELAWVGENAEDRPVELPLAGPGQESELVLVLDPPKGGFAPESLELAEWLVSQAAIALENAQLHHVVQWQATTDELTGLANRRRFMEALTAELGRIERFGGTLSLVLADLDDFKRINDQFGHHVGDQALRRFAALLTGQLREVDVSGRLGGEEFAVVLPGTDREGALVVGNRIRAAVARDELVLPDAPSVRFTVSLGAAVYQGGSAEGLLREADAALYSAKAEGKNRVVVAGAV
jgi:diguanylate cyclase (GGDEF)-like protein